MIKNYLKKIINMKRWRKLNRHNFTTYKQIYGDMNKIHVGKYTYGEIYVSSPNTSNELFIGDFCSIAGNVKFLLGADHPLDRISSYPFKANVLRNGIDAISKGNIIVDSDVWLGNDCIILSGVHIGQGAVVAAGAVVTADVPPYAIVGGVPAKVIKYRFSNDIIQELLKVDYSQLEKEDIEKNIDKLSEIFRNKEQLDWMPRKQ